MTDDTNPRPHEIIVLDDLINGCYGAILEAAKKEAKLGDLLRMIELRRKLTPSEEEQKQFWTMLEKVRLSHLKKSEKNNKSKLNTPDAALRSERDGHDSN